MITVIVIGTGERGSTLAADTSDGTEMLMTGSGRTVDRMSPRLWSYYTDWIMTLKKRM